MIQAMQQIIIQVWQQKDKLSLVRMEKGQMSRQIQKYLQIIYN